jgi:hypothetical protein
MLEIHVRAECQCPFCRDLNMQHWTCSMDMDLGMQHGHAFPFYLLRIVFASLYSLQIIFVSLLFAPYHICFACLIFEFALKQI